MEQVLVNRERRESSLVVMPDRVAHWAADAFDSLAPEHLAFLETLGAEIVLLVSQPCDNASFA